MILLTLVPAGALREGPPQRVTMSLIPFKITRSDVPMSAATAIHKFAHPSKTVIINAAFTMRDNAMFVLMVVSVLRDR